MLNVFIRFAATVIVATAPFSAWSATQVQAASAYDFLDTLGVGLHVEYTTPDNAYANITQIKSELKYLGFKYARDTVTHWNVSTIPRLKEIHNELGIKYMLFIDGSPQQIALVKSNLPMVAEVEGPNEVDNWPPTYGGVKGYTAATAIQKQIWNSMKGSPGSQAVPVDSLTVANGEKNNTKLGDLTPFADRSAQHVYPQWGGVAGSYAHGSIEWLLSKAAPVKTKPRVISEIGWWTKPAPSGVTEAAQAKFELDSVFDAFKLGVKRVMLYELADETNETAGKDREKHFGLFHFNGTPKASATAFHNLTTLLADTPASSPPGSLSYTLSGIPASAYQLLLQKSDGTFVLAIWNEGKFWDNIAAKEVSLAPVQANLELEQDAKISLYDPLSGLTPLSTQTAHSASIPILDHPLLVFIKAL